MNAATCCCTASTTRGAALPTDDDRDAGAEVDQLVAVDVDDDAAAGLGDVDGQRAADARRDRARTCGRAAPASAARESPS